MTSVSTRFLGQPSDTKWTFMTRKAFGKARKATTSPRRQPQDLCRVGVGAADSKLRRDAVGRPARRFAQHPDRVAVVLGQLEQARDQQARLERAPAAVDRP